MIKQEGLSSLVSTCNCKMVYSRTEELFSVIYCQPKLKEGLFVPQTSEVVNLQNIWLCILEKHGTKI